MRKLALALLLIFPFFALGQVNNTTDKRFSMVYKTDKTIEQVYSKTKEWIAVNFKSANAVVQLDTSDKIIAKGILPFKMKSKEYIVDYVGDISLTIAMREGRYKIDLDLIGETYAILYSKMKFDWDMFAVGSDYTKDELLPFLLYNSKKQADNMGFSKKQKEKLIRNVTENIDARYAENLVNKEAFDEQINNLFKSIKEGIDAEDDDWQNPCIYAKSKLIAGRVPIFNYIRRMKIIKRIGLTLVFALIINFIVELLKFRPVGLENSGANLFITIAVAVLAYLGAAKVVKQQSTYAD